MQYAQKNKESIGPEIRRCYSFPFKNWHMRLAPLALAKILPNYPDHPSIATFEEIEKWTRDFKGDSALVWGKHDPIFGRAFKRMKDAFPKAHLVEPEAGHFLQEEFPQVLSSTIAKVTFTTEQ